MPFRSKGNEYHEVHYIPSTDMTRVFRDVLKYVHKNNEYSEGSLLNRSITTTTTTTTTHFIKKQIFTIWIVPSHKWVGMIKLGLLQLGFFALYMFTYKDFKLVAVKDYNK